jgi:hypothetical protein
MRNPGRGRLRPLSFVGGLALAGCALGGSACSDEPFPGDFGPSSGYALVEGSVTQGDGSPVDEGMEVVLTRCELPVGGLAGSAPTGPAGSFSVRGELPPIGMPEGQDSVLVTCELIAGGGFAESGPLDVYFYRPPRDPTVLEVSLFGS